MRLLRCLVTVQRMRGMDGGPGTDLGTLGWFIGIWVTMTAAMMLPSAAPTVLLFSSVRRGASTWLFVVGYLLVWTAYGLGAYAVYRGIRASAATARRSITQARLDVTETPALSERPVELERDTEWSTLRTRCELSSSRSRLDA